VAVTPTCPVRYDPLHEATLADPYPELAALRAQAPLVWHDGMDTPTCSQRQQCGDRLCDDRMLLDSAGTALGAGTGRPAVVPS
jgi:hypothetical protein